MDYICPVCGYDGLEESAYNEYDLPSFEICSYCRFQFGDDDDVEVREGVFLLERKSSFCSQRKMDQGWSRNFSARILSSRIPSE
ncbi:hypothetical protein [Exiguobacterium sp. S3]|uniref:hypothetical protein n=1 Tax=Exiguobacterium sp. S3 TaxID=483245 RepID=UPI001BE58CBC|nr:hypothetical protein [Exiguobacterium sp. S3]